MTKWSGIASVQESAWANASGLALFSDQTEKVRISAGGNVGIGTTSPSAKLEVDGNIITEEVKVLDVTGADFVFEEDFELRTLNEVETFINQNGHLPDIPPATEMQENGIELGDMNMKLLQKIEELTLYVLALNERQAQLEKENKVLSAIIKSLDHDE